jgi:hypothetical protein
MPDSSGAILTNVQVTVPQMSSTPIKQVGTRGFAGMYTYNDRQASVGFTWLTNYDNAFNSVSKFARHMMGKTGGIVRNPTINENSFCCVTAASLRATGMEPVQLSFEMLFLNCPSMYATEFDPIEFFGVVVEDAETVIDLRENNRFSDLVTERSISVDMRVELDYALDGYRSIRFGDAAVNESVTAISSDYITRWQFDDSIYLDSALEQFGNTLSETGQRAYNFSRQAFLLASSTTPAMGW